MILVLVGLILLDEVARRTKLGGLIIFGAVPVVLTIYFIVIAACAAAGQTWAVENQTHVYMNGWFHYMKLYASLAGCIGFMMIKYGWGIGKTHWQVILNQQSTDGISGGFHQKMYGFMVDGTM